MITYEGREEAWGPVGEQARFEPIISVKEQENFSPFAYSSISFHRFSPALALGKGFLLSACLLFIFDDGWLRFKKWIIFIDVFP